jgi:ABC-type glycerol-3-phosphate transport system substrate-binding protein
MSTPSDGDPTRDVLEGRVSRRDALTRALQLGLSVGAADALLQAAGEASAATSAATAVTLEIWEQQVSINAAKPAVDAFLARYPAIKVKWVPTPIDQTPTKLLAAIAAGSGAPDIAFIQYTDMAKFTTRDGAGLRDLRPYMATAGQKLSDWIKWPMDLVTTKSGKVLGIPVDIGAAGTFYRRDVFAAAKLPSQPAEVQGLISTWDNFIATGKKITATGRYMLEDATVVFDIVRQQGAQGYFDNSGNPVVNSPEFVHAAEMALRVRQAKVDGQIAAYSAESGAAMKAGKVATYFSAAWFDIVIHGAAPETGGKWGTTVLPENESANFGGSYWTISDQSQHAQEAWKLITYVVASKPGMAAYLKGLHFLPAWKAAFTLPVFVNPDPFYKNQAWLRQFVKAATEVPAIRLNPNDPIAADAVSHAITDILLHGANIKSRLNQANNEIAQRIRS